LSQEDKQMMGMLVQLYKAIPATLGLDVQMLETMAEHGSEAAVLGTPEAINAEFGLPIPAAEAWLQFQSALNTVVVMAHGMQQVFMVSGVGSGGGEPND